MEDIRNFWNLVVEKWGKDSVYKLAKETEFDMYFLDETYELIDTYYEEGGEVETFFTMILEEYANSMGLGTKFKEIMKQQQN